MNWDRVAAERKMAYVPSPRSEPATDRQLRYIKVLAKQKGQHLRHQPRTKRGASDLIERLLAKPDVPAEVVPFEPEMTPRLELRQELQSRFPTLSPQTVESLIQVVSQVDELGMYFFFQEVMQDPRAPSAPEDLVPWLLGEFVSFALA